MKKNCKSSVGVTSTFNDLIVADLSCPKIQQLVESATAPVLWLDGQVPPLQAVSRALAQRKLQDQPVQTLHWLSHGSPGQLQVGETRIDSRTLLANAHHLASWGIRKLALWSCRTGASSTFITLLEELTGASIWSTGNTLGRQRDGRSHWILASKNANSAEMMPSLPVNPAHRLAWTAQLNNAPIVIKNTSPLLAAVTEDSTTPRGATVASLFGTSFSDTDGDTLAGVAITSNDADPSKEGIWQYSIGGHAGWRNLSRSLKDSQAFYIKKTARLRFLPAKDFNGTPGGLKARLIDNAADIPSAPYRNPFGIDITTSRYIEDAGFTAYDHGIAPDFVDIDGDGDLDAFLGNDHGDIVFLQNTGTSIAPAYKDKP